MGRHKKPTKLLLLQGAQKNHPERLKERAGEPEIKEKLGNVPGYLTLEQKNIWRDIIKPLPDGVLTAADRTLVELTTRLIDKMRNPLTGKDGEVKGLTTADANTLIKCLASMGMTPADRSRVNLPVKKPKGKWDD